jgi:hypothetical protein
MARPVRPGTGTTHRTSEASQPGMQNGTLFADPIRASSPKLTASTGRTEDCSRPTPIRQISLAMREPSTEDVRSSVVVAAQMPAAEDCRHLGSRLNDRSRWRAHSAMPAVTRYSDRPARGRVPPQACGRRSAVAQRSSSSRRGYSRLCGALAVANPRFGDYPAFAAVELAVRRGKAA